MTETKTKSELQSVQSSAGSGAGSPRRTKVLLVEGDGFTRLVLLLRLRLAGFSVDFTSNGTLGLRKLLAFRPDVLLMDVKLYGVPGLDVIKAARSEPTFRNRPIYVFTRVDHLKRAASKELKGLATQIFDKTTVSREEVVQALVKKFDVKPLPQQSLAVASGEAPAESSSEIVPPEVLEEIIAGVRHQAELLARCKEAGARKATAQELLSRVCSLADCAEAARLAELNRQTKALQNFLHEFCNKQQKDLSSALNTIARAVLVMSRMAPSSPGVEATPEKFKVVAIDEATLSKRALEQALNNAGCDAICFEDPIAGRKYLGSAPAALILINLRLPEAHALSLREIRQLPLHSKTPVLYVPEATGLKARSDDLPSSGQRLDRDPSLLSELVLMALNEMQSAGAAPPPSAPAPAKSHKPAPVSKKAVGQFDDGFALFTPPAGTRQVSPLHASAHPVQQQPLSVEQTLAWTASDMRPQSADQLNSLPIAPAPAPQEHFVGDSFAETQTGYLPLSAEPTSEITAQADTPPPVNLVVNPMDEHQAEELLMEPVSPVDLPIQPQDHAAPETTHDAMPWQPSLASTAAGIPGEAEVAATLAPYLEQKQPVVTEESHNANEAMNYPAAVVTPAFLPHPDQNSSGEPRPDAELRCAELEQQLAALRQAFAEYNGGLEQQEQAASDAARQIQELEERLQQAAAELEFQREQQRSAHTESRRQIEEAQAASREQEAAHAAAQARCAELESELANARNAQQALEKLVQEQKAAEARLAARAAEALSAEGAPLSEQEQQLRQTVAALARATADLAKERGERQRSDQRAAELNRRMQTLHEDLKRALQSQHEDLARLNSLEEQHRQAAQALEQRNADFEQEKAERQLATDQLQKIKDSNAQLHKDFAFLEETNKKLSNSRQELQSRLEASLATTRESEARLLQETSERKRLSENLETLQRELQDQAHKLELVQHELQTTREALQDRDAKLQQQQAERQRLSEALDSVQLNSHQGPERDLELSKLESALQNEQVQRKRQETQLARMRHTARNASQAAKELRTNLRRQIREPVDNLVHFTQNLLEMELGDQQKALAEAVLQDVLLIQTRLREPDSSHTENAESAAYENGNGSVAPRT